MKIISKYKDYYDYLTKIYGEDNKIVLDRREFTLTGIPYSNRMVVLYICNMVFEGYFFNGVYYWGEDLSLIASEKPKWYWNSDNGSKEKELDPNFVYIKKEGFDDRGVFLSTKPYSDPTKMNTTENCPIMEVNTYGSKNTVSCKYPRLEDYFIQRALPAQTIYLMLCEFLAPKDNIVDNRTNKEKVLTNGFDLKTSFRH